MGAGKAAGRRSSFRAAAYQVAVSTGLLFVFWLALSGRSDPEYLLIGLASSLGIAVLTRRLLLLPWDDAPPSEAAPPSEVAPPSEAAPPSEVSQPPAQPRQRPAWDLPWPRFLAYLPWLAWEIVKANFQVAYLILHPRLPVDPGLIRFRKRLPGPLAQLVLANSITLTPGTVTVDVEGDDYLVHVLSREAAEGLRPRAGGEGEMLRRVGQVFASGRRVREP